jgi:hypothetical protein
MSGCFIVGKMKGLTFTQYRIYSNATSIFTRVQAFNANVSTLRGLGNDKISYYQFGSAVEREAFIQGQMLLIQNDPTNAARYATIPQN